ncbi:MAG: citrate lyase subunit alpha [Acidobacteria bacterium]|nr:citrate lyase subunit alpha [Acidobacteriota bacterium]
MIKNVLGRVLPEEINGLKTIPYQGVGKYIPRGRKAAPPIASCANYPSDGNKVVSSLREALEKCGLRDGMTLSAHHHFRNGDKLMNMLFDTAAEMGVRDLMFYPSATFPCHEHLIRHLDAGVIHHIEGSLNGPLGAYCSAGKMRGLGVLRSHGGRYTALQDGEVHVNIAVIAAPTADPFGNATGSRGPSACGLLGFALGDSQYADKVIVVTDNLEPFPCAPFQIHGNLVDWVVVVDEIGDPSKIVSGTTELTKSPDRLYIAELTARFIEAAGIMRDGFSMQAGAGGTNLAFAIFLRDLMREAGVKARFIRGGSTKYLVEMLEEGLTDFILDGQTFDTVAVESIRNHPNRHVTTSPFTSYNYHSKGNFASIVDVAVLGATEVDIQFNANVATHSDGILQHGLGGWPNCLAAKCTILALPSFRDRIPVLVDEVTTVCGPGELIDVIVTERGIAINPRRQDLLDATKDAHLPVRPIQEIQAEVERICGGKPEPPQYGENFVAAIKWVDGTVMDALRELR